MKKGKFHFLSYQVPDFRSRIIPYTRLCSLPRTLDIHRVSTRWVSETLHVFLYSYLCQSAVVVTQNGPLSSKPFIRQYLQP